MYENPRELEAFSDVSGISSPVRQLMCEPPETTYFAHRWRKPATWCFRMSLQTVRVNSLTIVRNYLQFVPVCRSLLQFILFTSSLKICRESMGSNLGHDFSGHPRCFRGSRWVTASCERQLLGAWTFNAKGGQGREAHASPSGYDGFPILDLYSSISSFEQSMPAASQTIFSVSIFTEVELPGLKQTPSPTFEAIVAFLP